MGVAFGAMALFAMPGPGRGVQPALAAHGNEINVEVEGPAGIDAEFTISGTGCAPASFDLTDEEDQDVTGCANGTVVVDSSAAGFVLDSINCSVTDDGDTDGLPNATTFTDTDTSDGDVNVNISDDEHVTCLFTFSGGTQTATATGTPGTVTPTATGTVTVAQLTVSIAPSTLSCNGSAFVTVVARNSAGQVVAAGPVTLATNLGTISPTSATDQGAGVLAVLTAPAAQGGTATVSVSAGGQTGTATAQVNCAQATAVPPTAVPPTQVPATGIIPPSTGDAGLAGDGGWRSGVAFGLLGLALSGALALAWKRSQA
jgi:hypothetical protein